MCPSYAEVAEYRFTAENAEVWGHGMEVVSGVERRDKSCHYQGWQAFSCPHPNPLPLGEGAHLEPLFGSLSQRDRERVRVLSCKNPAYSVNLPQSPCPVVTPRSLR